MGNMRKARRALRVVKGQTILHSLLIRDAVKDGYAGIKSKKHTGGASKGPKGEPRAKR